MALVYDPKIAKTIYAVGRDMNVSRDVMLAALAAALVESNMKNVNYGDRDSLGVFQQRPSQGWGSPKQVRDPEYAARKFFQAAKGVTNYSNVGDLAQQVQRSAYPDRYQQRLDDARKIFQRVANGGGAGGVGPRRPIQAASRSGGDAFAVDDDDDDAALLRGVMDSMVEGLRGPGADDDEDDDEFDQERDVDRFAGTPGMMTPAAAPVDEEGNPHNKTFLDDPGVEAMHQAGDTATGTRARSDPNWTPGAWGGFDNGKIPLKELATVRSNGVTHRLEPETARRFRAARAAARRDGVDLTLTDSYRDYASQVRLAEKKGLYSQGGLAATPGTSDHGWGKAFDLDEGREWMAENGERFGFKTIPREPWHWQVA